MKKSFLRVAGTVVLLLLVPLTAMQFTNEVRWSLLDFVAMGLLLFAAGIVIELIRKKVANPMFRTTASLIVVIAFLLLYIEMAVGIVGAPFGGLE